MNWLKNLFSFVTSIFKKSEADKWLERVKECQEECSRHDRAIDDADDYDDLHWMYGGFKGQGAEWLQDCEIADLKIGNKLSYRWIKGGCEALGAIGGKTDASHTLACLFCLINGRWVGGKFDWISTSRTTRDFHNIETEYKGWDRNAISKAEAFRFVIVSKNGKFRSNIIEVNK